MATKFASRQNVVVILGAVMIVCLALTIVTFPIALIWFGQPLGNAGLVAADAFASVFSVAFFAAFALAMAEQRSRSPTDLSTVLLGTPVPHDQNDQ
jgi:MFS-type transporter involved in bile tolerance (Atg22 family)